ncbi:MAG: sigma-70 family RNA polymerase sigma factor [Planctomycetota bacterium]
MLDPQGESTRGSLLAQLADTSRQEAWLVFDRRYGNLIVRYACGCGLSFADADDVRQESFLLLLRVMKRFRYDRSKGRFRSYLVSVVRRTIGRRHRLARERPLDGQVLELLRDRRGADSAWALEWERMQVRHATDRIRSSVSRDTLDVFDDLLRGVDVTTISEQRGVTRDAVYKVRSRITARLQKELTNSASTDEHLAEHLSRVARA